MFLFILLVFTGNSFRLEEVVRQPSRELRIHKERGGISLPSDIQHPMHSSLVLLPRDLGQGPTKINHNGIINWLDAPVLSFYFYLEARIAEGRQ